MEKKKKWGGVWCQKTVIKQQVVCSCREEMQEMHGSEKYFLLNHFHSLWQYFKKTDGNMHSQIKM